MNNNSSELNTLLIATTVFAIGGLGLFMYNSDKTVDNDVDDDDADSQSDNSGSDFSLGEEEFDDIIDGDFDEGDEEEVAKKPKKGQTKRTSNRNSKTKKNSR
jgi:hypothetical protein